MAGDVDRRLDHVQQVGAELRPIREPPVQAATLLARWKAVPVVDPARLGADLDAVLDPSL